MKIKNISIALNKYSTLDQWIVKSLFLIIFLLIVGSGYAQTTANQPSVEKKEIKQAEKERRHNLVRQERTNARHQRQVVKESRMEGDKKAVKTEKNAMKEERKIQKRQRNSSKKDAVY